MDETADARALEGFRIPGRALVSFSGGRTSAYMLWRILHAHGGALPPDFVVAFANTGREREETLRFVHECGARWGVRIHWLEMRDGRPGFAEVGYNSASRNGEPFSALIAKRRYLPNAVTRFCTSELKIRVIRDFCRSLGWERWTNVVGLRADEPNRVRRAEAANEANRERWTTAVPLSAAGVTARDVLRFWLGPKMRMGDATPQGFDLGLHGIEGNCALCFLKGRRALEARIRSGVSPAWEVAQEASVSASSKPSGARFVTEFSFSELQRAVARQPDFLAALDAYEFDAECGLTCVGDVRLEQFKAEARNG